MTTLDLHPNLSPNRPLHELQLDRHGMKLASRLSEGAQNLPHDISERLRSARVQALALRKHTQTRPVLTGTAFLSGNALSLGYGDEGLSWWNRLASVLPLVLLVYGLLTISSLQDDSRADETAEVDAALLTDDLPPSAYADPAFVQFLKANGERPL
ncbi:MAG: DUF3619 family protein [Burkholderiaceae bacterium]